MAGSKKEIRKGIWDLTVSLGFNDAGKRIRKYKRINATSNHDADKQLALFVAECERLRDKPDNPDNTLVRDFYNTWITEHVNKNLKVTTMTMYRYGVEYAIKYIGHMRLKEVKPIHILKLISKYEENYNQNSVKTYKTALSSMFSFAMDLELIESNPCHSGKSKLKRSKNTNDSVEEMEIITIDQALTIIEELEKKKPVIKLIILAAIYTGMRTSELLGLKWSEINFVSNEITIKRQRKYDKSIGYYWDTPKTKKSKRIIEIPGFLIKEFLEFKKYRQNENVFVNKWGEIISYKTPYRAFKKIITDNGLPDISFHDLRSFYTSACIDNGANLKELADSLGHADLIMISRKYSRNIKRKNAVLLNDIKLSGGSVGQKK